MRRLPSIRGASEQLFSQDERVFATNIGRIVVFSNADLVETKILVKIAGHLVRWPDFKEHRRCLARPRSLDQVFNNVAAKAIALAVRMHADIQQVSFASCDRQHAMANNFLAVLQHPAFVVLQAIKEDAFTPRVSVPRRSFFSTVGRSSADILRRLVIARSGLVPPL